MKVLQNENLMARKISSTLFLTIVIPMILSFPLGIFYERRQESKNTLDIDRSLVVLLARPSDFDIAGGKWVNLSSYQSYFDPTFTSTDDHKGAGYSLSAYFPATETYLGVSHDIRRYVPEKIPQTTWLDEHYRGTKATDGMEIHWLSLKELDKQSRAFCTSSKNSSTINCYFESNYDELVSNFSIWASNMEEAEIINFLTPAIQKFYDRLSETSIKFSGK